MTHLCVILFIHFYLFRLSLHSDLYIGLFLFSAMTIDCSIVIYHLVMKIIDVAMASKGKIALLFKQDFLFFQTIKWASRRVQQSIAQKV